MRAGLNSLFKGYQGQKPQKSSIFFLGRDANFDPLLRGAAPGSWQSILLRDYKEYLQNFGSWIRRKENRFRHHPFLKIPKNIAGRSYHEKISEILFEAACGADDRHSEKWSAVTRAVCFAELLPKPNWGERRVFEAQLRLDENKEHVSKLKEWFKGEGKLIFVPKSMASIVDELLPSLKYQTIPLHLSNCCFPNKDKEEIVKKIVRFAMEQRLL